jgi:hypothetical protein
MTRRPLWLLYAAAALAVSATVLQASTPRFWLTSTQADLLKGQVERLSIDEQGRLVPGPAVSTVFEATGPFLWTIVAGADGTLYAGGGNDGRVWRIDRQGKGAVFFDAPELEVHAVAAAADGTVYVGTSPDGKVYKVDAQGKSAVFFDPEDKYIWALAFDPAGRLLVATGDKGVVYRVGPDGTSDVFCRTQTTHATSLLVDRQGQVLIGTETPARLLRVSPAGKAFVLLDSPYREIRGLRIDAKGTIYAAAVNGKGATAEPAAASVQAEPPKISPTPSVSAEITAVTVIDMPAVTGAPASPARPAAAATAKGAVYRIGTDGGSDIIWEMKDDQPFDLSLNEDGSVLVATGSAGKLYRLSGEPTRAALVTRLGGQQVTSVVTVGASRYFATSNPARVVRIDAGRAPDGQYLSEAKDAGTVASWGAIAWRAVAAAPDRVQVFTRAGNTPTPDDTWSDWAGPYQRSDGDAVTSPAARYFQWKAVLKSAPGDAVPPALISMSIAYLQRNLRPRVTGITVNPPGVVYQKPYPAGDPEIAGLGDVPSDARTPLFSMPLGPGGPSSSGGPALGRRMYQKGLQSFTWRADDDNDDRLKYDIAFRTTDDSTWHLIRRQTEEQILTWDTTSVADGTYVIKVVASDAAANRPDAGLAGELESDAFEVDNGAPAITVLQIVKDGTGTKVSFEVRDGHSAVAMAEFSVDAGRWQTAYPADGAADSRVERFEIRVEGEAAGRVIIRASDAMNNATTARVEGPRRPAVR